MLTEAREIILDISGLLTLSLLNLTSVLAKRFDKIFIQPQIARHGARDLCDFEAVCQTRAK